MTKKDTDNKIPIYQLKSKEKVLDYYDKYLSPKSFRLKFIESLKNGNNEIICNDDHRSVEKMNLN